MVECTNKGKYPPPAGRVNEPVYENKHIILFSIVTILAVQKMDVQTLHSDMINIMRTITTFIDTERNINIYPQTVAARVVDDSHNQGQ